MAKTNRFGALAVAAGALVAATLLVLVLVVVKPQPAGAAFPGTNGLIAYSGIDPVDGDREIFAIHPDFGGSQGKQLTFNNTPDYSPCYSPDGTKIGYIGHTANNGYQIFTIPANGGQRQQVTPDTVDNPGTCSFTGPRGTHIVYSADDGQDREIWTIPANGGTPDNVTDNLVGDYDPSFTAVGRQIAYSRVPPGASRRQIFTIPANGGNPTQLTTSSRGPNDEPDYRPDGQRIVYEVQQWRRTTTGGHPGTPVLTPLDYEIATKSATVEADSQLVTLNTKGDFDPVYSPNGQQIAYSSTGGDFGDSTDYEIWTIPAEGGEPVQVSFNSTDDRDPSWGARPLPALKRLPGNDLSEPPGLRSPSK
jgi:TolB protein